MAVPAPFLTTWDWGGLAIKFQINFSSPIILHANYTHRSSTLSLSRKPQIVGEQVGPSIVHMHTQTLFGRGVLIHALLPLEPTLQKVVNVLYTEKKWIEPFAKIFMLFGEK